MKLSTVLAALTAVCLTALFLALGGWQLERAREKSALEARFAALAQAPALRALPASLDGGSLRYSRVEIRGRYDPQSQVLLDNMTHDGAAGYHVLTPFVTEGGKPAAMVNRGFVPAPPDRRDLPAVPVEGDERVLRGRLDALPVPALRLPGEESGQGTLRVMSFPTPAQVEHAIGRELVPYQVLLDFAEPDGYVRAWSVPGPDSARNIAYAGQWFALAGVTVVGFLAAALGPRIGRRS